MQCTLTLVSVVSFILLPILGVKSPKTRILEAWICIFKLNVQNIKICIYRNYCTDYNRIVHSHKDHQILIVGGPNTRKTNPRWRTAAILKNGKSAIEQYLLMRRPVPVKSVIAYTEYAKVELPVYATLSTLPISPNKTAKIIKTKTGFSFSSL